MPETSEDQTDPIDPSVRDDEEVVEDENSAAFDEGEPLSEEIVAVFRDGSATIGELIERTKGKGFGFLLVVFGLPNALPLPPGAATPFGLILVFLCAQIVIGRKTPWFPKWILERKLAGASGKFLLKLAGLLKKIERFLKPRFGWLYRPRFVQLVIAPIMLFAALCVSLPLPGTNSTPSLGLGLVGIGMLEEDGLLGTVGMLLVIVGAAMAVGALWLIFIVGQQVAG